LSVGYVSGYFVSFWMLGYSTGSFPGMLMGLMSLDDCGIISSLETEPEALVSFFFFEFLLCSPFKTDGSEDYFKHSYASSFVCD